ncbi:MAG: acyl-CoA thioesterase [Bdellovibrionales bacterium]|nr:acyl-CoA thioesterase [Bdellovibrionales bacterium]MBT3526969.1 acyl-CoA thioesterase [Bdellovibrionales bacterium]MBT7670333.1 acyl-CoA thioesterase [Bdellovibrionales bacterium]MBT7766191.1 acyl-CoA thioesterase [Bdellovibrionales bacterium]
MTDEQTPLGELAIQTLAMPADTNPSGDIFGGWVLSQMDIAGGIVTRKTTRGRTVTVAVDAMSFYLPVAVGDTICCYVKQVKSGNTSITVSIEAWASRQYGGESLKVTEGLFTYVAVDQSGLPEMINKR